MSDRPDSRTRLSRQQRLLRAVPLPATAAFLVLAGLAGTTMPLLFAVPAVVLAVLVTLLPDSSAGVFLLLDLVVLWAMAVPERLDAWPLAAAADLLVLHLAVALAAAGPAGLVLPRSLLRAWGRRAFVLLAATVPAWLVARLVAHAGVRPTTLLTAAGLGLVLAWGALLTVRLDTERPDGDG
ncbi:MAG: hypothetical protein ACXVFU_12870 [Nocardioidaceae bacterium]